MRGRLGCATALAVLAGCGGSAPAPPAHPDEPLVFMSREEPTYAVPEDVAVYADGRVRYRYLLHTKINMKVRAATLSPAALASLRRLVERTDLSGAQRLADPPRGSYRYLLRIGGRSITTADGHLTPAVRPLVTRLARLQDRLLLRGEQD